MALQALVKEALNRPLTLNYPPTTTIDTIDTHYNPATNLTTNPTVSTTAPNFPHCIVQSMALYTLLRPLDAYFKPASSTLNYYLLFQFCKLSIPSI